MRTWTGPSYRGEGLVGNNVVARFQDETGTHTLEQLPEQVIPDDIVELRVHGVNGGTPEQNLQDPSPVRIAGDDTAGFYRRRSELRSGPRRVVEAYNWSSINSKKSIRAWWLVLFPFAAANFAGWLLPKDLPDDRRRWSQQVVRLIGLAITVISVLGLTLIFVDMIGVQCSGLDSCNTDFAWGWVGSIAGWGPLGDNPVRLAVAYSLLPALAILVLWLLGRRSRHYEDYGAGQPIESADGKPFQGWIGPEIDSVRMDRVEFWQAPDVVYVQAWLHATAGLSALAATMAIAIRELVPHGTHHELLRKLAIVGMIVVVLTAVAELGISKMHQIPSRSLRKQDKEFWKWRSSWIPAGAAIGLFVWVSVLGWTTEAGAGTDGSTVLADVPPLEAVRNGLIVTSLVAVALVLVLAVLVRGTRLTTVIVLVGPAIFLVGARSGDDYVFSLLDTTGWLILQIVAAVVLTGHHWIRKPGMEDHDPSGYRHDPVRIYGTTAALAVATVAVIQRGGWLAITVATLIPILYITGQFIFQIARAHDYPEKEHMREATAAVVAGLGLTGVMTIISSGTVFVAQRLSKATALPQLGMSECPEETICYPAEIGWYSLTALAGVAVLLLVVILRLVLLYLVRWRKKAAHFCEEYDDLATSSDVPHQTYDIGGGCNDEHHKDRLDFAKKGMTARMLANVTDDADWVISAAVVTTLTLVVAAIVARIADFLPGESEAGFFGAASWAIAFLVVGGGAVIYTARDNRQTREMLGMLWDVMSFFPRRFHPLAPPCYAERAVIDVRNRLIHTTTLGDTGRNNAARRAGVSPGEVPANDVILVAHSEGSLIATAALLSLLPSRHVHETRLIRHPGHPEPTGEELEHVAFVTYGCMLARLYSRAWPDQLPEKYLVELKAALEQVPVPDPTDPMPPHGPFPCPPEDRIPRWVNFGRYSDYLGGRVFAELQRKPMNMSVVNENGDKKRELSKPERKWTDGDLRCDDVFFIDPVRRWRWDGQLEHARIWRHSFDYESDTEDPRFREHIWFIARVFNGEDESDLVRSYRRGSDCQCHPEPGTTGAGKQATPAQPRDDARG
jgi:hypothetical protein